MATLPHSVPARPRSTLLSILLLWAVFYASFSLVAPPLLDDADSVHVEVAREMLLRHDYVTLYADGIRYLEKAPLLYWAMACSMKIAGAMGAVSPRALTAAARVPLALAMLALALVVEAFARRLFRRTRAGLYAALFILSSFGIFIFTRITIPDGLVCLWIACALYCFWRCEELELLPPARHNQNLLRLHCGGFAACCALNVLTKGLIGVVFPVGIVAVYLLLTRGWRGTWVRLRELHPLASLEAFLLIAAPWHVLAGLANPTQGRPAAFRFIAGHWVVPLPMDGNVRGWFWFYFMNEHVLRYLNLRIPHDYDTAPLWLFWGLCLVWMLPWSAFAFRAAAWAAPLRAEKWRGQLRGHELPLMRRGALLLLVWTAFVLLFFSLSTRQEYYVLPALPAVAMLVAGWFSLGSGRESSPSNGGSNSRSNSRMAAALLGGAALYAMGSTWFLVHTRAEAPSTDLSQLLAQNPGDYALSMGHFLDLNTQALGLFRVPLTLSALSIFAGTLAAYLFLRRRREHAAIVALAAGTFGLLLAAHLALQTFAPVLSSAQLAEAIAPQVKPQDIVAIHGEYESGSTLSFYLKRSDIHILEGRSSNLWYGSFFPDAPAIFETNHTFAAKWPGPARVFLWQSLTEQPRDLPPLRGPIYLVARGGGKEIISNQPNR